MLTPAAVQRVARILAAFYRGNAVFGLASEGFRAALERRIRVNDEALRDPVYGVEVDLAVRLRDAQLAFLRREAAQFGRRIADGRVVEGHGDLRPEHVCLEPSPVIFDRLEFDDTLRIVDAVDELASLASECERLGAAFVGGGLFSVYAEVTGDRAPAPLIDFYKVYRSCLRARLALGHTRELPRSRWPEWRALAADSLRLAARYAARVG